MPKPPCRDTARGLRHARKKLNSMSTQSRPTLRNAVNAKCKECVFDPHALGNWREQVADCRGVNCPLYSLRPVPRSCMKDGEIDPAGVHRVRRKLGVA